MTFQVILTHIVFWLILSERNTFESIVIGTVVCIIVRIFNTRHSLMKLYKYGLLKGIKKAIYHGSLWLIFGIELIKEIVIANIHVARVVLSPKMEISPHVTTFTTKLESSFYRTILANSITLTPGTLTVDVSGDNITVHCLKKEYSEGLLNSEFERILLKLEEGMNE